MRWLVFLSLLALGLGGIPKGYGHEPTYLENQFHEKWKNLFLIPDRETRKKSHFERYLSFTHLTPEQWRIYDVKKVHAIFAEKLNEENINQFLSTDMANPQHRTHLHLNFLNALEYGNVESLQHALSVFPFRNIDDVAVVLGKALLKLPQSILDDAEESRNLLREFEAILYTNPSWSWLGRKMSSQELPLLNVYESLMNKIARGKTLLSAAPLPHEKVVALARLSIDRLEEFPEQKIKPILSHFKKDFETIAILHQRLEKYPDPNKSLSSGGWIEAWNGERVVGGVRVLQQQGWQVTPDNDSILDIPEPEVTHKDHFLEYWDQVDPKRDKQSKDISVKNLIQIKELIGKNSNKHTPEELENMQMRRQFLLFENMNKAQQRYDAEIFFKVMGKPENYNIMAMLMKKYPFQNKDEIFLIVEHLLKDVLESEKNAKVQKEKEIKGLQKESYLSHIEEWFFNESNIRKNFPGMSYADFMKELIEHQIQKQSLWSTASVDVFMDYLMSYKLKAPNDKELNKIFQAIVQNKKASQKHKAQAQKALSYKGDENNKVTMEDLICGLMDIFIKVAH